MFLTIFFLVVIVCGGYIVYRKYFRNVDENATAEQDAIIRSAGTTTAAKRRVRVDRSTGHYYDFDDNLIEDLFLIALLDDLIFDGTGYAYPTESLYEEADIARHFVGAPNEPVLNQDGLTADEQRVHDLVEKDAPASHVDLPETANPVRESTPAPTYIEPERSYGGAGGDSYDSGSSDLGGGGGSDD